MAIDVVRRLKTVRGRGGRKLDGQLPGSCSGTFLVLIERITAGSVLPGLTQ